MFAKFLKVISVLLIVLSLNILNSNETNAATKVMWGMTELTLGQIGKVTVLADTDLVKFDGSGSLSVVRTLKKGEEYRVYNFKSQHNGLYGVGGGNFVAKNERVLYETPSKNKLAQLANAQKPASKEVSKPVASLKQEVDNGLAVIPGAPKFFQNCTEMREYYPHGVKKGHPAYAGKHDRDKDNWACER
ncbi:excalibur calcium-binding domain-containing protein [Bacillus sp. FJAT-22090]|uniref:excalibur calcium-binding domain-containing protein n=1 Tax=Bacillus sp. FJAT-22090 TaxID=1581038 RepID=UPI0021B15963|nr:excalibur calcium-binding domain-containing protein [Bacillus sp. FJAT-22090]